MGTMRSYALTALVLLLCASLVSGGTDGALTFTLELGENRCFFEQISDRESKIFVHVSVIDGGHDVNLLVSGPHDKASFLQDVEPDQNDKGMVVYDSTLQQVRGEQRLLFVTKSADAVYRVCVKNGAIMMKSVALNIKSHDPTNRGVGPLKPMEPIQQTIIRLSESLHNIKEEQIMLRARERLHRETAETTYERVVFWSLFATVMLMAMGGGQVWYYYSLFGASSVRSRGV
eukprot:TRINITY_DN50886_c0_g1_i1.p1 TRINITY_DN50886_c0_g1~~TRINITY_DN50886_c0_g1_i1.p1  ORF type:complete len:245 (+),score=80.10 TRINITY_DN50886_c0_g1_i1:44-736(+)